MYLEKIICEGRLFLAVNMGMKKEKLEFLNI